MNTSLTFFMEISHYVVTIFGYHLAQNCLPLFINFTSISKRQRKLKGQPRTDNPETQATLSTRHRMKTNKTKNTTQKTKKMSNTNPPNKTGMNPSTQEGRAVPVSQKTPALFLIQSSPVKVLSVIEERKNLRKKETTFC